MQVLGRLAPQLISLAAPQALRKVVCGHFTQALATSALVGASLFPAAEYAVPSGHLLAPPLLAFRNPRDVARHAAPKALTAVADFDCRAFAFAAIIRPCTLPAPWGFLLSHGDFFISTPELFASAGVM
jgi:hypothetical protein